MQTTIPACCACLVYIYCMFGALYDSVSPLNTAAKASVHLAESAVINHKTICTIKDDGVIYLTVLRQDTPGNNIQIDVRVGKYFWWLCWWFIFAFVGLIRKISNKLYSRWTQNHWKVPTSFLIVEWLIKNKSKKQLSDSLLEKQILAVHIQGYNL